MTRSPALRTQLSEALADVRSTGLGVVAGRLSAAQIAEARDALWAAVERAEEGGERVRGVIGLDPNEHNVRVFHLLNKGAVFRELIMRDDALAAARAVIGDDMLISNFSANIALPGSASMPLHADQGYVPAPWPPDALAVNVMWLLDDYTDENGATRWVPDAFGLGRGPEPAENPTTFPIEAPAGSMVIMDGRVWHTSGHNRTDDQQRAALFAYYVQPWLRQQINWTAVLDRGVVDAASPALLELLGYGTGNMELRKSFKKTLEVPS